jgi:hypothetical protein
MQEKNKKQPQKIKKMAFGSILSRDVTRIVTRRKVDLTNENIGCHACHAIFSYSLLSRKNKKKNSSIGVYDMPHMVLHYIYKRVGVFLRVTRVTDAFGAKK